MDPIRHAQDLRHADESVRSKLLDAVVAGIGDKDVAKGIGGNVLRTGKLSITSTGSADNY